MKQSDKLSPDLSDMKYTPGPWASTPGTFGHHSIYNAVHKNGIADVMARPRCGRKEDIEKAVQEGLANARLIASAPDLLEELKETHAALCMGDSGYLGSERYQRNREAITQAQGFYFE